MLAQRDPARPMSGAALGPVWRGLTGTNRTGSPMRNRIWEGASLRNAGGGGGGLAGIGPGGSHPPLPPPRSTSYRRRGWKQMAVRNRTSVRYYSSSYSPGIFAGLLGPSRGYPAPRAPVPYRIRKKISPTRIASSTVARASLLTFDDGSG